jgi:hypothetical protein
MMVAGSGVAAALVVRGGVESMNAARAEEWMRGYIAESLSHADLETFIDDVAKSVAAPPRTCTRISDR